jgi:hypothetical protein
MDYAFQGKHPPHQLHALVAQNTNALEEQEWYADSATNAHITNDLDNLHLQQPFQGTDSIGVGNCSTLAIANSGFATLHSPYSSFSLKDVLHCPKAATNLISIQRFCTNNDCFFPLNINSFLHI